MSCGVSWFACAYSEMADLLCVLSVGVASILPFGKVVGVRQVSLCFVY